MILLLTEELKEVLGLGPIYEKVRTEDRSWNRQGQEQGNRGAGYR